MNHDTPTAPLTPEKILQTGMAFWASKTLLSATELGLFTTLAAGPLSAADLGEKLQLHARSRLDFLDALVALGFLQRTDGLYRNTPETALFMDRNQPSYIGGLLEMANARLYPFWANLTDGLRSGEPQNELKSGGANFFVALYADPLRLKQFLAAMTGLSHGTNLAIANASASALPWHDWRSFCDIGCAQGDLAVQIALAQPHLTGKGFDLPPVQPVFDDYAVALGVSDRVQFSAGDFMTQPLPQADVILMGHILHDWDMPTKHMLIQKAFDALPAGGALVVYDAIIDDDRSQNTFGLLMSLNMLIETPGGFDYTGEECAGWMGQVGFASTRVQHLVGPDSMVVGIK